MTEPRKPQDILFPLAAVMQIAGTLYLLWLGVSSASNGETKRATWAFIVVALYVLSMAIFFTVWRKSLHQGPSDLAKEVEALKASNLQQRQYWEKDRSTLLKKLEALENPIPHVAMSAYAPGSREAHIEEQWRLLNSGEKEVVRFVLFNGTVTLLQVINHMLKEGFADGVKIMNAVKTSTSFVLGNIGDLHPEFTINPEVKADLMRLSR